MVSNTRRKLVLAAPLTMAFAGRANAQDRFPSKTTRIIVPFVAGSQVHIVAR